MWFAEHSPTVRSRRGNMIPVDALTGKKGFRSVFCFAEEDAKQIRATCSSRGFEHYPAFSDTLFIDFDDGHEEGVKWAMWAKERGFTYSLYLSGNKGAHLEIVTVPKFGRDIPHSQKELIKRLQVPCDYSLYRHGSLYRLPGTLHEKTGQPKVLIDQDVGNVLVDYSIVEAPPLFNFTEVENSDGVENIITRVLLNYKVPPEIGVSRTQRFFGMAKRFADCGISYATCLELIRAVNASWGPREKDDKTVVRVCKEAYQ